MRSGLIVNMIIMSLLFLLYMFIKKKEKQYLSGTDMFSDLVTFYILPTSLFLVNIPFLLRYKHPIFLIFMALILIPLKSKGFINKERDVAEVYGIIILNKIEERLLIDKDLISLYINVKQKDAKIVFKKDLNLDKNSLNSLKEELIDLTKLSFEFIFDEEV
ncbi:MAG: hypothetical protein GX889_08115 [Clostridiales bacterium]|nr:hypothetical protein [Clostridiales bacterium]